MLVFYTTFHLSDKAYEAGLDYMRTVYIPAALKSGRLSAPRLQRVVSVADGAEGVSLSVQFRVADNATLQAWMREEGEAVSKALIDKFGYEIAGFSTILEELELT